MDSGCNVTLQGFKVILESLVMSFPWYLSTYTRGLGLAKLLQLEEATPSTTPYRDHHRGGPLRLPGGRKVALRENQKRNNERLNGKRMLYVIKEKPFHFDFR
ncbi:hypothetical protein TNCV_4601181 [Trichonephila clavipes]|nr:hypothetical protein TNCV_4601181 [Trichonephila clavipes]